MNVIRNGKVIAMIDTARPVPQVLPGFERDATITSRSHYHRPVNQTRELILSHVADCGERSVLEIARHLERKATPFLRQQLRALVDVGLLVQVESLRANGAVKFSYRVGQGL